MTLHARGSGTRCGSCRALLRIPVRRRFGNGHGRLPQIGTPAYDGPSWDPQTRYVYAQCAQCGNLWVDVDELYPGDRGHCLYAVEPELL